jgi:hypothetical protein
LLRGPEKDINLTEQPVSPDQRYLVLSQWQEDTLKKSRNKVMHILDRESGKSSMCKLNAKDLSPIGWKKTDEGLRLMAVTNRWQFDKNETSELYSIDPITGDLKKQEKVDARLEIDNPLSPDGKYRVRLGKDELIVTSQDDGSQRRFVLHQDDRRFVGPECMEWVSPRYLKFNGQRMSLIDMTTMKMCYPIPADGAKLGYSSKFSSDFRWVLYQEEKNDEEGLFLAPIELPKGK